MACFKYILLFFKLVYLSCILHIASMTLTRRRRRWWCCIGVTCSSTALPAGNYTMYVGLGLSIYYNSRCNKKWNRYMCVCVCVCVCVYAYIGTKAQLVWYMKHKQYSSSYASLQQLHYTNTYTRTHTYICTHICVIAP